MGLNLIYFVYGLAFFTMGIKVWARIISLMDNRFARTFGWLAAFGIIHAVDEWIKTFVIMGHISPAPLVIATLFSALSFAALLKFGIEIININKNLAMIIRLGPAILFLLWFLFYLKCLFYEDGPKLAEIWSRYTLGLSGTLLTAYALISMRKIISRNLQISRNFFFAGVFFGFYGMLTVIVPELDFFPASVLNDYRFTALIGLPLPIFSMLSAIAITHFMVNSLDVFDIHEKRTLAAQVRKTIRDLEESEEKYRSLAETASDAVIMSDEENTILFANRATENIFGYSTGEMLGQQLTMLMPESLRHIHEAAIKRYIETERHIVEVSGLHKSGKDVPLEISFGGFVKEGKHFFIGIVRDITERKRTEEKLRQRHETFQSLYESAIMWRGSLIDRCDQVVTTLSQLLKVSRVTIERLEGEWIKVISMMVEGRLIHEGMMPLAGSPCERVREEKGICQYHGSLKELFPEDDFFHEHDIGTYLGIPIKNREGDVIGVIQAMDREERVIMEDEVHLFEIFAGYVSREIEQNVTEEQLRQAQKMDAVGQLAGGVAHDFNNLLTAIQGYTDLSLMAVSKEEPVYRNLMGVRRASIRAAALTRQLLVFSRQQPTAKEILGINSLVEDMSQMFHRLIGEDISLQVEFAPDLWSVEADVGQMEQVLMNLVVNARDAMPNGGSILIKTENAYIDETYCCIDSHARPGRFVCLLVEDIGVGINVDTKARIFEPFFTTKGVGKGTGLGLSVVYGIVTKHDGWINVYSEPGHGSTFRTYLPAVFGGMENLGRETEIEDIRGGQERILLVEDEKFVCDLARQLLEKHGYQVLVASTYKEALSVFQGEGGKLDMLFTDVVLPDRSGFELAEELKRQGSALRVLFASGYSSEKIQLQAMNKSSYCFLQKPYSLSNLLRTVRKVLDEK